MEHTEIYIQNFFLVHINKYMLYSVLCSSIHKNGKSGKKTEYQTVN